MKNVCKNFGLLVATTSLVLLSQTAMAEDVENKLELNAASVEEIMSLGVLTREQADNIVEYRAMMGDIMSYEELDAAGLNSDTIETIKPLTTINFMSSDCSC